MKVQILGHPWKVRALSKRAFEKRKKADLHLHDAAAYTDEVTKELVFQLAELDYYQVMHEVTHAHLCYMMIDDITPDDWQEYICEFVAKHGKSIMSVTESILEKFRT